MPEEILTPSFLHLLSPKWQSIRARATMLLVLPLCDLLLPSPQWLTAQLVVQGSPAAPVGSHSSPWSRRPLPHTIPRHIASQLNAAEVVCRCHAHWPGQQPVLFEAR